jgi:hypothetical protein
LAAETPDQPIHLMHFEQLLNRGDLAEITHPPVPWA